MEVDRVAIWSSKWKKFGKTPYWQKNEVHFYLKEHYDSLNLSQYRTFFVPLCGRTLDMKWLYDKGHSVVGVECAEMPIVDFFEEHNLKYLKCDNDCGTFYQTEDEQIKIYCCDFFNINLNLLKGIDVIWDRASLVVVTECDREKYFKIMKHCLKTNGLYLLDAFEYTPSNVEGPPHIVTNSELQNLFGDTYNIQLLETRENTEEVIRERLGADRLFELLYAINLKQL